MAGDGITNVNHVTLTGTAVAGSTVEVFDGATQIGTATANSSGAWTYATATLADGSHAFTAKDVDTAGNVSTASAALNVTVDTAAPAIPSLVSFSPDSNVAGDGITTDVNHVTLTGTAVAGKHRAGVRRRDEDPAPRRRTASGALVVRDRNLDRWHARLYRQGCRYAAGNVSAASAAAERHRRYSRSPGRPDGGVVLVR